MEWFLRRGVVVTFDEFEGGVVGVVVSQADFQEGVVVTFFDEFEGGGVVGVVSQADFQSSLFTRIQLHNSKNPTAHQLHINCKYFTIFFSSP